MRDLGLGRDWDDKSFARTYLTFMESYDIGRFAYLALLLIAVGGWAIAEARGNWGKAFRQLLVWGFIGLGLVAAYGLWGDIRDDIAPRQALVDDGVIEVPLGLDGHYHLTLQLNGQPVDFVIDTGASDVVLTRQDAEAIGLNWSTLAFTGQAQTANGAVSIARANVEEIRLGDIVDRGFRVSINGADMDKSLLGMSYLRRFERIEIADNTLVLTR